MSLFDMGFKSEIFRFSTVQEIVKDFLTDASVRS